MSPLSHSRTAESAVLGSMLLASTAIDDVRDILSPEDFFTPAHALICGAIFECRDLGQRPDPVTVEEALRLKGHLGQIGGSSTLLALMADSPAPSTVRQHAKIVRDHAGRRELAKAGTFINGLSCLGDDLEVLRERAVQAVFSLLAREAQSGGLIEMRALLDEGLAYLQEMADQGQELTGVPSGLMVLDQVTKGFQPGTLTVIAGRPGMGKSSLGMTCGLNCSVRHLLPVLYRSGEMGNVEMALRMISSEARVNGSALKVGSLDNRDWERVNRSLNKMADAPFWLDTGRLSVPAISSQARMIKAKQGHLGMVVIDQLQLFPGVLEKGRTKAEVVGEIVRGCKEMANDLEVPVLLMAQFNREAAHGPELRIENLKDSGGVEEHADLVLGITHEEAEGEKGVAKLHVLKHRSGEAGITLRVAFLGHYTCFANLAEPT